MTMYRRRGCSSMTSICARNIKHGWTNRSPTIRQGNLVSSRCGVIDRKLMGILVVPIGVRSSTERFQS